MEKENAVLQVTFTILATIPLDTPNPTEEECDIAVKNWAKEHKLSLNIINDVEIEII